MKLKDPGRQIWCSRIPICSGRLLLTEDCVKERKEELKWRFLFSQFHKAGVWTNILILLIFHGNFFSNGMGGPAGGGGELTVSRLQLLIFSTQCNTFYKWCTELSFKYLCHFLIIYITSADMYGFFDCPLPPPNCFVPKIVTDISGHNGRDWSGMKDTIVRAITQTAEEKERGSISFWKI